MQDRTEDFEEIATISQYSPEERMELLRAAVAHVNAVNPDARINIINMKDLPLFIEQQHHQDLNQRYRLIVHTDGMHFTAVDVNPSQNSCIVLDAAGDDRGAEVKNHFEQKGYTAYYASKLVANVAEFRAKLQYDRYNCSMFALDHCIQLARSSDQLYQNMVDKVMALPLDADDGRQGPDAFEDIKEMKTLSFEKANLVPWDCLPPNFLWNAQSLRQVLVPYAQRMEEVDPRALDQKLSGMSYREYVATGMDKSRSSQGEIVDQNRSIDKHVFSWADRIYHGTHDEYKATISQAMQSAMDKSRTSGILTLGKGKKLERLAQIKQEFDTNPDAYPSFCPAYIHRFESEAKMKRNPVSLFFSTGETNSSTEFRKQIKELQTRSREGPLTEDRIPKAP